MALQRGASGACTRRRLAAHWHDVDAFRVELQEYGTAGFEAPKVHLPSRDVEIEERFGRLR